MINMAIKPWGKYIILEKNKGYWIKKLFVSRGKKISLQSHQDRSEIWSVLSGKIEAIKGKTSYFLETGEFIEINKKQKHRIIALKDSWILEVAFGKVREKDIVRYKDDYGRI